jgi:hypothetical protein
MSNKKNANEFRGYSQRLEDNLKNATKSEKINLDGINNDRKLEPLPNFRKAPCEEIAANGQNNAQIIVGRDRPSSIQSGYGGRGDTQSGAMDIVVGRYIPENGVEDEAGDKIYVDPNFQKDSARIYISQRTDVDKNFNIVNGGVGSSIARSGIAIKADAVRIIGREGIKLVTKTENINSLGGKISTIKGIDLIAGNKDGDLQPIVKGNNLLNYLKLLQDHISSIVGMINSLASKQIALDSALASHTHITTSAAGPGIAAPSIELAIAATTDAVQIMSLDMPSHTLQLVNTTANEIDHLNSFGSKYILSKYNKTN